MRFLRLLFVWLLLAAGAHAGVVAVDDADESVYANSGTFYNGQNGGSGFAAWTNGVNSQMATVSGQELTGLHYWKISGAQTLCRLFADSLTLTQGSLSLTALHEDGGAILLTSAESESLLKVELGSYWDENAFEFVSGFIFTSGETVMHLRADGVASRIIDYTIEWDTALQTYDFQAVIDQGEYLSAVTNTFSGALAFASEIGGIAFGTGAGEELHFDGISVIPEPVSFSLTLPSCAGLLMVRRLFFS